MAMIPSLLRRDRVGVVIANGHVDAVLVRRGEARCQASQPFESDGATEALRAVLERMPRSKWLLRDVIVALGPERVQVRHLRELPRLRNERAMRKMIGHAAERFFLGRGETLVTTGVSWTGPREGVCAAFERLFVDRIVLTTAAAGYRVSAVVPLAALPTDDPARIARLRFPHPLAHEPEAVRVETALSDLLAPGAAVAVAGACLILAPAFAALATDAVARHELQRMTPRGEHLSADVELFHLLQVHRAINRLAAMPSATLSLSHLTAALPENAFVSSLALDSIGGIATIVASRAEDALDAVSRVNDVDSAEITGVVRPERIGGETVERSTVRFRWRRDTR